MQSTPLYSTEHSSPEASSTPKADTSSLTPFLQLNALTLDPI